MSKIKICGLRRQEDAEIVNEGRPDFAGFILTPSKRQVTVKEAEAISQRMIPSIARVGVFAKETPGEIAEAASFLELEGIQLHFDTTPAFLDELLNLLSRFPSDRTPFLWQRIAVSASAVTGSAADLSLFDGLLLDSFHDGQDGGTGKTFLWQPAMDYIADNGLDASRIIVAGGLTADNVAEAILFFKPYAVDVSSGVETNGYKDREKVLRFLETARKAQVQ